MMACIPKIAVGGCTKVTSFPAGTGRADGGRRLRQYGKTATRARLVLRSSTRFLLSPQRTCICIIINLSEHPLYKRTPFFLELIPVVASCHPAFPGLFITNRPGWPFADDSFHHLPLPEPEFGTLVLGAMFPPLVLLARLALFLLLVPSFPFPYVPFVRTLGTFFSLEPCCTFSIICANM
ncbi:hypothetical protein RSAG8_12905, partial [Rhizoctonia solani AG-8 WAC10335]